MGNQLGLYTRTFQELLMQQTCSNKLYSDKAFSVYTPRMRNTVSMVV